MRTPHQCVGALALAPAGCGSNGNGDAPERKFIDEDQGIYRGVGFGDSASEVIAVFGKSPPLRNEPVIPLERDLGEVESAPAPNCPAGRGRLRVQRQPDQHDRDELQPLRYTVRGRVASNSSTQLGHRCRGHAAAPKSGPLAWAHRAASLVVHHKAAPEDSAQEAFLAAVRAL